MGYILLNIAEEENEWEKKTYMNKNQQEQEIFFR